MAELDDGARVTVVDWPAVLPVAESHARQLGLAIRLDTIAGNYHEVELPHSAFDIAILGNVTHLETPDGNAHLMNRASEALRPGGVLLVFDVLPSRDEGRLNAALYELGLALRTASGRVYSAAELTAFMEGAGLRSVELLELEVPPFAVGMLKATKPVTGRSGHHAGRA
jgi:SAM-dependent methyltransferase